MMIIHLGTNDLDVDTQMGVHHRARDAMAWCRNAIPYTAIVFLLLLPRRFNSNYTDQTMAARVRRKFNTSFRKLAHSNAFRTISHPHIDPNDPYLFFWDGLHLANEGYNVMLDTFASAVRFFFNDHSAFAF